MTTLEHLLTTLGEEGSEVSQECSKAVRFGIDDAFSGETVRDRLVRELNQLVAMANLCAEAGLIPTDWQHTVIQAEKRAKFRKFLEYSRDRGTLIDPRPYSPA